MKILVDKLPKKAYMIEMKKCPFCGKEISINVYDNEGNYRGELGCAYEKNPWNGIQYGLHHGITLCVLDNVNYESCVGGWKYDSAEEAIESWNERVDDNG